MNGTSGCGRLRPSMAAAECGLVCGDAEEAGRARTGLGSWLRRWRIGRGVWMKGKEPIGGAHDEREATDEWGPAVCEREIGVR